MQPCVHSVPMFVSSTGSHIPAHVINALPAGHMYKKKARPQRSAWSCEQHILINGSNIRVVDSTSCPWSRTATGMCIHEISYYFGDGNWWANARDSGLKAEQRSLCKLSRVGVTLDVQRYGGNQGVWVRLTSGSFLKLHFTYPPPNTPTN